MDKKPPPVRELYSKMFKALAEKYSTGEIRMQKINGFRTSCEVAFVKLFSDKNGEDKNKAILVLNEDEGKSIIIFAPLELKNGKGLKNLFEISSSGKSGEPNASFGEQSCGIARVMRFRSKHDAYAFRARSLALDMLKDINYFLAVGNRTEALPPGDILKEKTLH